MEATPKFGAKNMKIMLNRWLVGTMLLGSLAVCASSASAGGQVIVGQQVTFVDLSSNFPMSWGWDFDYDAGLGPLYDSLEANPTWTFNQVGSYDVYHQACNFYGCTSVVKSVEVIKDPMIFSDDFELGGTSRWSSGGP